MQLTTSARSYINVGIASAIAKLYLIKSNLSLNYTFRHVHIQSSLLITGVKTVLNEPLVCFTLKRTTRFLAASLVQKLDIGGSFIHIISSQVAVVPAI